MALTQHFTLALHGYSDGTYSVSVLRTDYVSGRLHRTTMVSNRWCTAPEFLHAASSAAAEIVALVDLQREQRTQQQLDTIAGAPRPPGGAKGGS